MTTAINSKSRVSDVVSQKSLSSSLDGAAAESTSNSTTMRQQRQVGGSSGTAATNQTNQAEMNRKSFGSHSFRSTSSDVSSGPAHIATMPLQPTHLPPASQNPQNQPLRGAAVLQQHPSPAEMPSVDGVAAGRATAVGDLCKIVCAKSSREQLSNEQLAQFYLIVHRALVDRDRLVLCSLLYHSVDLFKLGLAGVEILLPNYLMAVDIILTESMKLRLHPSIDDVEMRNACLLCIATILPWPSTFGACKILGPKGGKAYPNLTKPASTTAVGMVTNVLDPEGRYIDLRARLLQIFLLVIRNEEDPSNIQLALALCSTFCWEQCRYDFHPSVASKSEANENDDESHLKSFSISTLRAVVSAMCDKLCQRQNEKNDQSKPLPKLLWQNELSASLSGLDALNSLAALPHSVLFHQGDLSMGNLIVSSLCRYIDFQLQRPPPHHSRDLHSSVVAALGTLCAWLTVAPMLKEIDPCLALVSQTIELAMTGSKGTSSQSGASPPKQPASQRVLEAAEHLLHSLFASKTEKIQDEAWLVACYGEHEVRLSSFRHYMIGHEILLSLHEAQHIQHLSKGLPSVLAVLRTPFQHAHAFLIQLKPTAKMDSKELAAAGDREPMVNGGVGMAKTNGSLPNQPPAINDQSQDSLGGPEPIKQFEFPPGVLKPQCKLDAEYKPLESNPEVNAIQEQLAKIRTRLEDGAGSAAGDRDAHNMWIQAPLGSTLSQPPKPASPVHKCDSARIFLYDMGLINRLAYGKDFVPLGQADTVADSAILHSALCSQVDSVPTKLLATVHLFYVRDGQRAVGDILHNHHSVVQNTSADFCCLLTGLGNGVEVRAHQPHWTGHLANSLRGEVSQLSPKSNGAAATTMGKLDAYALDGASHCLWWENEQVEVAFILPTERTLQLNRRFAQQLHEKAENEQCTDNTAETNPIIIDLCNAIEKDTASFHLEPLRVITTTESAQAAPSIQDPTLSSELLSRKSITLLVGLGELDCLDREMHRKASSAAAVDQLQLMWGSKNSSLANIRRLSNGMCKGAEHPLLALGTAALQEAEPELPKERLVTIFTAGPSLSEQSADLPPAPSFTSGAPMSLTTATTVIAKSARFSPRRRQNFVPVTNRTTADEEVDCSLPDAVVSFNPVGPGRLAAIAGGSKSNSAFNLLQGVDVSKLPRPGDTPERSSPTGRRRNRRSSSIAGGLNTIWAIGREGEGDVMGAAGPVVRPKSTATTPAQRRKSLVRSAVAFASDLRRESLTNLFASTLTNDESTDSTEPGNDPNCPPPPTPPSGPRPRRKLSLVPSLPLLPAHLQHPFYHNPNRAANTPPPCGLSSPPNMFKDPRQGLRRMESRTSNANCSVSSGGTIDGEGDGRPPSTNNAPQMTAPVNGPSIASITYIKTFFRRKNPTLSSIDNTKGSEGGRVRVKHQPSSRTMSSVESTKRESSASNASITWKQWGQSLLSNQTTGSAGTTNNSDNPSVHCLHQSPKRVADGRKGVVVDSGVDVGCASPVSHAGSHLSGHLGLATLQTNTSAITKAAVNVERGVRMSVDESSGVVEGAGSSGGGTSGSSSRRNTLVQSGGSQRIFVVWLERIEDMRCFPYDKMLPYTEDGTALKSAQIAPTTQHHPPPPMIVIYLHSFEPGLVRVHVDPLGVGGGRSGLAAPLQEGMCVSLHTLPALLQQTVTSIARRRLIEVEGTHQPHLRRRQAIGEFGRRFEIRQGYADFLEQFIRLGEE